MTQNEKKPIAVLQKKKEYIPPVISMVLVEIEQGIAAGSATVTPVTINGATDQVTTEWEGTDDTTITAGF